VQKKVYHILNFGQQKIIFLFSKFQ